MAYDRNGNYVEDASPTDASRVLSSKVDVSDDGQLKVFGKELDVGRNGALILRPLIDIAISQASIRGASYATRWGTNIAGAVMPRRHAAKVGKGLGWVWMFGLPAADVGLGIKKTVSEGFKDMHDLREKWQPLLAANNNMHVGVDKALTCNFGVFAHARAKVYENGKRNLLGTIAGGIRAIPTILMGVYQNKLDNIKDPRRILQAQKYDGMTKEERNATAKMVRKVRAQRRPQEEEHPNFYTTGNQRYNRRRPEKEQDLISTISRLFTDPRAFKRMRRPLHQRDLEDNLRDMMFLPPVFGLGGELIDRHITKKGDDNEADAGDKILELQAYVHNHDQPDREKVVEFIRDIFQQRARDIGRKYEMEGDTFGRISEAVADAVVYGLHPQALAELLDNKKVIAFGPKDVDFGELDNVNTVLAALKEKYTTKVSEKQFYKNAPFTKESLVKTLKEIPAEEKPFFVMLFPEGILEKAGVDQAEVKKYREEGKKIFLDELVGMTKMLMEESREELTKRGVKSKVIDEFEAFKEAFRRAESNDHGAEFLEKGSAKASRVVRNVTLSVKKPADLWQGYLKKRGEEAAARIPTEERKGADHIASENETGDDTGAPGRQM